jgi:hypothetical protein
MARKRFNAKRNFPIESRLVWTGAYWGPAVNPRRLWPLGQMQEVPEPRAFLYLWISQTAASKSGPHDFAVRQLRRSSGERIRVHRIPPHVRDDAYVP